jgi:hypothetical protein
MRMNVMNGYFDGFVERLLRRSIRSSMIALLALLGSLVAPSAMAEEVVWESLGERIGNSTCLFHGPVWYGFSAALRS